MGFHWKYLIFGIILANCHAVLCLQCPEGCQCSKSYLECANNNMKSIPTNFSVPNITVFNVSSNQIRILEEKVFRNLGLVKVEIIDLSYNSISDIHPNAFDGLTHLKELYLQGNNLTNIKTGTFSPLENLNVLDLRNNSIDEFDSTTFQSLKLLQKLSLSGLQSFNAEVFQPLTHLKQLQVEFGIKERNFKRTIPCQEQVSKVKEWCNGNNVTDNVHCVEIPEDKHSAPPEETSLPGLNPTDLDLREKSGPRGEFIIGIVITVGVLLLLITSLVILAVIVRQTESAPEEIDDSSYMSEFEPYRGHISPLKNKQFYWSHSRDNIPKSMQESSVTPREDMVCNSYPNSPKLQENFKTSP